MTISDHGDLHEVIKDSVPNRALLANILHMKTVYKHYEIAISNNSESALTLYRKVTVTKLRALS